MIRRKRNGHQIKCTTNPWNKNGNVESWKWKTYTSVTMSQVNHSYKYIHNGSMSKYIIEQLIELSAKYFSIYYECYLRHGMVLWNLGNIKCDNATRYCEKYHRRVNPSHLFRGKYFFNATRPHYELYFIGGWVVEVILQVVVRKIERKKESKKK